MSCLCIGWARPTTRSAETTQSRNSWRAPVRFYELFVNNELLNTALTSWNPFRRPSQFLQHDLCRMDLAGQIARYQRSTREARANPFQLPPDNRKRPAHRQFARVIRLQAEPIHPR